MQAITSTFFDPAALPAGEGKRIVFSCAAGVRSVRAIEFAQAAGLDLREQFIRDIAIEHPTHDVLDLRFAHQILPHCI